MISHDMTNLIALAVGGFTNLIVATSSSELRTNVTETPYDPATIRNHTVYGLQYGYSSPPPPPSEKWVTTKIERIEVLEFDWSGSRRRIENVTPITNRVEHLRLKQEWEPAPKK